MPARSSSSGSPEELYERPATRFVADFIGTTNLLQGTVEGVDGEVAVIALGSGERIRAAGAGLRAGRAVELSVRPETIDRAPCQRPIRR